MFNNLYEQLLLIGQKETMKYSYGNTTVSTVLIIAYLTHINKGIL